MTGGIWAKDVSSAGTILCASSEGEYFYSVAATRRDARREESEAERAGVSHASESRAL